MLMLLTIAVIAANARGIAPSGRGSEKKENKD